jgi:hypothetical protein
MKKQKYLEMLLYHFKEFEVMGVLKSKSAYVLTPRAIVWRPQELLEIVKKKMIYIFCFFFGERGMAGER